MFKLVKMKGFLLVDKPSGITSFDVVRAVRRACGVKKVGHAGTLDPLATGLLLLAIGDATKLLEYFIGCDKEYEVVGKFGYRSDSYDADGEIEEGDRSVEVDQGRIEEVLEEKFSGVIQQMPPKYSALKVGGKRACDIVREGGEVELKTREVTIHSYEVVEFDWPLVRFRVRCGSGTYVRSLINDLGDELGCGAYVQELRRTVVGEFEVSDSLRIEEVDNKVEQQMIALERAVECFPKKVLSESEHVLLRTGALIEGELEKEKQPIMAFYNSQLAGVLEAVGTDQIKMRKQIQY